MTLGKFRSWLYRIARLLGDVQAVRKGRVGQCIARRAAGRLTGAAWDGSLNLEHARRPQEPISGDRPCLHGEFNRNF